MGTRVDLNAQCIYRRQADETTRRKEKWRESKSISLFLSRENCHCQYITTHENGRWKWISCLVGRILKRKSVFDKAIFYLSYNFVLFRKRLWCFSVRPYVVPFYYGGFGATFRSRQTTKIVFKNIVSSFYYIIMSVFAAATRRRRSLNHHHQCRRVELKNCIMSMAFYILEVKVILFVDF